LAKPIIVELAIVRKKSYKSTTLTMLFISNRQLAKAIAGRQRSNGKLAISLVI